MDDRVKRELLEVIGEFLDRRAVPAAPPLPPGRPLLTDRDLQVVAAALMVCVVRADHKSRQDEHRALSRAIARILGVDTDTAARVVRRAEQLLAGEASFADFVDRVNGGCDDAEKRQLVECLWRIAYADAELEIHEEYVVRKVAEHLRLSTADLVEAKVRAREGFLREDL